MSVKADKKTRDLVYSLCNGIRREPDICDYLMCYKGSQFYSREMTEKAVRYHISKLRDAGLIYIKDNGRILDLER
tara:strand:- start:163 stop:387 length:225 start_codon:yes stop_codon:yes gene_type:complete